MGGYCLMIGSCYGCGAPLQFNPNKVPSIRVNGEKQPLCRACFDRWNQIHRVSQGLEPIPLDPQAYEPEPEENV